MQPSSPSVRTPAMAPAAPHRFQPLRQHRALWRMPLAVLMLSGLMLSGCERAEAPVVAPQGLPPAPAGAVAEMPGIPASGADLSVPAASGALSGEPPAAGTTTADGNGPNQRSSISESQERQSMPLPGQNNDHSNTVTEDKKAASAPAR